MKTSTIRLWAALRWLAAFVVALGPALVLTPISAQAAPAHAGRPAPKLAPLADAPQSSPFTVNDFADTTDGECSVDHCTLREAVIAANALPGADEIILPAGTYVLDLVGADEDAAATGDLDLTDDLTLTGVTSATTIISGTGAAFGDRLFEITGTATVSMSNVGLTGGYVDIPVNLPGLPGGGAVFNWGTLTLSASRVYSNFSDLGGGLDNLGVLTLTHSLVFSNTAVSGGGLNNRFGVIAGMIAGGIVVIDASAFTGNSASEGGGLSQWGAQLTIENSLISGNQASVEGGGISTGPLSTIDAFSTQFLSNTAGVDGGGLLLNGWSTLINLQVTGNVAGNFGGGLANFGSTTVYSGTFTGNSALTGGGLAATGETLITNTQFISNAATEQGGGIFVNGRDTVLTSTFTGNTARNGGGLAFGPWLPYLADTSGPVTIEGSTFLSNTAVIGGGLYQDEGDLHISGSLFARNVATGTEQTEGGGGVFNAISSTLTISLTQFVGNLAAYSGGGLHSDGAASVYTSTFTGNVAGYIGGGLDNRGTLRVVGSTFDTNDAEVLGGGLAGVDYSPPFVPSIPSTTYITRTTFTTNTAQFGGAVNIQSYGYLSDSLFQGNSATQNGGALALLSPDDDVPWIVLQGLEVISNTAGVYGGGLILVAQAAISNSLILSNTAGDRGGGLYNIGRLAVTQSDFISNSAPFGGGLLNFGQLTLSGGAILSNTADAGGGLNNFIEAVVDGTTFAGNTATYLGGGVVNYAPTSGGPSNLTLQDTLFRDNTSDLGGGLYNSGNLTVTAGLFAGNVATGTDGGGLYSTISGTLAISLTQFISNSAAGYGGGFYTLGSATIYSSTFTANTATSGGGGLASGPTVSNQPGTQPLTIDASTFLSNTATEAGSGRGGGLFVHNPVTLTNSYLAGNSAIAGGGIFNFTDSRLVIRTTTITSNTAGGGGGIDSEGPTDVQDSLLTHNQAVEGGAIHSDALTLTRVLVAENSASVGGGLYVSGFSDPDLSFFVRSLIQNSAILSNTAAVGGGLYSVGDDVRVLTTTIAGNTATQRGGGIFAANGLTLTNVTISGNHADGNGGGLAAINDDFIQFGHPVGFTVTVIANNVSIISNTTTGGDGGGVYTMLTATVRLTNTLLAGNVDSGGQAPDCAGPLTSGGYNLVGSTTGCTVGGNLTGVLSNTAALVGPLADNGGSTLTHALLAGSPALDAGNPAAPGSSLSACAPADQRGVARPFGPRCDIGAYESDTTVLPTVQFAAAEFSAGEAAATLPFTVTLDTASAVTVTVDYTTSGGTATPGADYVAATGTLTFTPGLTATQGALTLLPDLLDELDETVFLSLTSPVSATLGAPATAALTLVDDDPPPSVAFTTAAVNQTEITATTSITVQLSAPSGLTVSVSFTTTPGTALPGLDYAPAGGTVTFAPGLTQTQVLVLLLGDALDENDETLFFGLSAPVSATLGVPATATLTIVDDDPPPSVQWSATAYTATEALGSLTLTATLSAPSGLTITVAYTSVPGTALAGSDYLTATGVLTFAPGVTTQTVTLSLLDDDTPEAAEDLTLTLDSPSNASLGAPATTTITLEDADQYRLYLPLIVRPAAGQGQHDGRLHR